MNQQLLWELLETDVTSLNEVWHLDITKALQLQAASQKQDMTKIKLKKKNWMQLGGKFDARGLCNHI